MADEFGQWVKGLSLSGDTIVSTDGLIPIAVKKGTTWVPFEVDSTTGAVSVNVNNTSIAVTGTVTANQGTANTAANRWPVTVTDGTNFMPTMDAISRAGFQKITNGTNTLAVNGDGSINVSVSGAANTVFTASAGVNLVKATPATVVTRTPASVTEYFKAFSVTGTGLCHWELQFGTTGSELTIMDVWTTPSHPFEYVDLPDSLAVTTAQTILVKGTNSEKAASPASDFTGYATLIRGA